MSYNYIVGPEACGWSVRLEGGDLIDRFTDFEAAERRARWMAARQAVRGLDSQVDLLDAAGFLTGRWIDERFEAERPHALAA